MSNPNPAGKIPADVEAVDRHDMSVIPQLIKDLQSDDAAVRLYAIEALHRLTGENLGYRYYDCDNDRAAAVQRWRDWYDHASGQSTHAPATQAVR